MKPSNPFVINGYVGAKYFCDREEEAARLAMLVKNGNNVVLSSQRRIGKTDLIHHLFAQPEITRDFIPIYVDLYPTTNLAEFVNAFGKAITDALRPRGRKLIDGFLSFLTSLRSELTLDINGMPVWGVGIGKGVHREMALEEIFRYLNASETPCLVAIDEFQQIVNYKNGPQLEALLRSYIQRTSFSRFIFAGSQRHIMAEMFTSPSRPFFQSTSLMGLPLIDKDVYADFCMGHFEENGKELPRETAYAVYDKFEGVTLYMHRVMNELYAMTSPGEKCRAEQVETAVENILRYGNDSYSALWYQTTDRQRELLLALAKEGKATEITGAAFVSRHGLKSQSAVAAAAKTLIQKNLITRERNVYFIYDLFFSLWIRKLFLY